MSNVHSVCNVCADEKGEKETEQERERERVNGGSNHNFTCCVVLFFSTINCKKCCVQNAEGSEWIWIQSKVFRMYFANESIWPMHNAQLFSRYANSYVLWATSGLVSLSLFLSLSLSLVRPSIYIIAFKLLWKFMNIAAFSKPKAPISFC